MNPSKNLIKTNWKNLGLDEFAKHCLGDGIVHLVLQVAATEEKNKARSCPKGGAQALSFFVSDNITNPVGCCHGRQNET